MSNPRPSRGRSLGRVLLALFALSLLASAIIVAAAGWWVFSPMPLQKGQDIEFTAPQGSNLRAILRSAQDAGVPMHIDAMLLLARHLEFDTRVRAGSYLVTEGDSRWDLLQMLARGDAKQSLITLVEGHTAAQIVAQVQSHPDVVATLDANSPDTWMEAIGAESGPAEGWFWPDTYAFVKGSTDAHILRRAWHAQQRMLERAWAQRDPNLPLANPYEALILASIIEKETGRGEERPKISGVFINRLRIDMPLQTDPTVIYGLGNAFDGNLRRVHLRTDNPWNTYTRRGLPPTPIASASWASLLAAVQPAEHRYLFFVARGDGTSAFSQDYATHNRYVDEFQRSRRSSASSN